MISALIVSSFDASRREAWLAPRESKAKGQNSVKQTTLQRSVHTYIFVIRNRQRLDDLRTCQAACRHRLTASGLYRAQPLPVPPGTALFGLPKMLTNPGAWACIRKHFLQVILRVQSYVVCCSSSMTCDMLCRMGSEHEAWIRAEVRQRLPTNFPSFVQTKLLCASSMHQRWPVSFTLASRPCVAGAVLVESCQHA